MVIEVMALLLGVGLPFFFEKSNDTFKDPFFGTTASLAMSAPGSGLSVNVTLRAASEVPVAVSFPPLGNPRLSQASLFEADWLGSFQEMSMLWMFNGWVVG